MSDTPPLDEFSKEKLFAMYVFIEQWIEENKATKEDTAEYADKVQQLIELQIYLSEKYYSDFTAFLDDPTSYVTIEEDGTPVPKPKKIPWLIIGTVAGILFWSNK